MPRLTLRAPLAFENGFDAIRTELDVPASFPPEVLEAASNAQASPDDRVDLRHLEFIAIDPPGATDLDQAFVAERLDDGFRVFYAIADVGAFLEPGGVIDLEARGRGTTLYSPDMRTPLHPPIISEDRASLLAGTEKPSVVWTIDLDASGMPIDARLERATVMVREAIPYAEAQRRIDAGDEAMGLLKTIGQLRQDRELDRGGVSLNLPAQEVVGTEGSYSLEFDTSVPVEGWNAQISLLTGIVAGHAMYDAGVGILRTLPPTRKQDLRQLRRQAKALKVEWPEDLDYPEMVRSIDPDTPAHNAFLLQAARSFRGAGYLSFSGEQPDNPEHGAIASIYGHVTAPLRRLVDRFANEILLALYADTDPPAWAVEALEDLPSHMGRAKSKESALERSMVNFAEALVLECSIGERFQGFVVDLDEKRDRAVVQLCDPAVVANVDPAGLELAQWITARVDAVDLAKRSVDFTVT